MESELVFFLDLEKSSYNEVIKTIAHLSDVEKDVDMHEDTINIEGSEVDARRADHPDSRGGFAYQITESDPDDSYGLNVFTIDFINQTISFQVCRNLDSPEDQKSNIFKVEDGPSSYDVISITLGKDRFGESKKTHLYGGGHTFKKG